jgi:hypothetical protein
MIALLRRSMLAVVMLAVLAACSPTGEGGAANGFANTDITGANYARASSLPTTPGRRAAWPTTGARWSPCSSAIPSAPTCARPTCSTWSR